MSGKQNATAGWWKFPCDEIKKGGFSGAVRADDGATFPVSHFQVDVANRLKSTKSF